MQDKLPDVENTPAVTKPRRSRFSFSDVASSRVDAESETGIEQLPEITEEPENPLPLQEGTVTFCDGTEAVAPGFETTEFTEAQARKTPAESEQATQAASIQDLQSQSSLSIPERRQHSRKQILLFTYAMLGEDNGGLVFNLSEGGLALTAAAALREHQFSTMRVRFPDSADWFETSGRLAWKNDSGREAGIEFLGLPADARARIGVWVSQADLSDDFASREGDARSSKAQAQELPSFMDPALSGAESIGIPASFEEQPFDDQPCEERRFLERTEIPPGASSALLRAGIRGTFERAWVRRRVAKIRPPRIAHHSRNPRTRVTRKALSIAAGVALAAGGWMFSQRTSLDQARNIIMQNLLNIRVSHGRLFHEPTQVPASGKTDVGASETADSSVQPAKTQSGSSTPSLHQIEKPTKLNISKTVGINPSSGSGQTLNEKPPTKDTLDPVAVQSSPQRSTDRAQQHKQETTSPQFTASAPALAPETKRMGNQPVESRPVENKSVPIAQDFHAQNKDLNGTSPLPSPNPSQPVAAPPVEVEKEKLSAAAKQPEPVLERTAVVTVSFDPFPSILMPKAEKPKKSQQGKNLQMGRLVSRVDPLYPEEAKQQGIEGTVKVHAIFNREGAVQSVISVSGPPLLVVAAINAVRQWRYSQTILGGQAMETEEDVTVVFRLANSAAKN